MPKNKQQQIDIFSDHQKNGVGSEVVFSESRSAFVMTCPITKKTTRMCGLTKELKRIFYPKFSWDECKEKSKRVKSKKKKRSDDEIKIGKMAKLLKSTGSSKKFNGMITGKIVHEQIEMAVNLENVEDFLSKFKPDQIEPHTYYVMMWMIKKKFTPVKCEIPVFFKDTKVATAVDILCKDEKGDLIIIEVKTGMEKTFNSKTGQMEGCLKSVSDNCPKNQAQLQLLLTQKMFFDTFGISIKKCFVVRSTSNGVESYSLCQKLNREKNTIIEEFKKKAKKI